VKWGGGGRGYRNMADPPPPTARGYRSNLAGAVPAVQLFHCSLGVLAWILFRS